MGTPKVFISYSWDNILHKTWVRRFAARLREDGVETILDQWHVSPGDQLPAFMETAIRENDFVLIVCTPKYKLKADKRAGAVGYEGDIIQSEIFTKQNHRKFIPILREGEPMEAVPSALLGKYRIDLRDSSAYEANYDDLLLTLRGKREQAPPVGQSRRLQTQTEKATPDRFQRKRWRAIVLGSMLLTATVVIAVYEGSNPKSGQIKISCRNGPPPKTKVNPKDGLTYVLIPPGGFWMGCFRKEDPECGLESNEEPRHFVTITKGFWIGQTVVTQAAYEGVTNEKSPSHFRGDMLPVESVTWDQAKSYCSKVGMRLPTEAEWEYAARGQCTGPLYGDINAIAWYCENSGHQTHPVGQKLPNYWWLYDMLGNVYQWTADYYDDKYYGQSPEQDPQGPPNRIHVVLRGGSWESPAREVRLSERGWNKQGFTTPHDGFRCVGED